MKLIIFSFLTLSIAFAGTCQELFKKAQTDYLMLQDLTEIEGLLVDENTAAPLFSESLMLHDDVASTIGEFDAKRCETALAQDDVLINDSILEFVYTSEDNCDGGNSYGYVKEGKNVVGVITDSEIYCL